jgi:FkbM family methyltransferase
MITFKEITIKRIKNFLKNSLKMKNPFRYLLGLFLILTGLNKYVKIKLEKYKLYFSPTALSFSYFVDKNERTSDEMMLNTCLGKDDVFVDIGANIGTVAIPASIAIGENGKVYAMEPHPNTFVWFKKNIELNNIKNISAINCAIGETKGTVGFTNLKGDDQNSVMEGKGDIEVDILPLNQVVTDTKIKLVKIDTEGYEFSVLKGMIDLFPSIELIFLECNDKNNQKYGYKGVDVITYLEQFGYSLFIANWSEKTMEKVSKETSKNLRCYLLAIKDVDFFQATTKMKVI